jgi:vacuolar iron transporter family protein
LSHATTDGLVGHYLAEEIDAAYLYRELAAVETDGKRRDLFQKLAEVEDRHVERWEGVLAEQGGVASADRKPTGRARLVAWVARRLGPGAVLPMILREEGREVAAYLRLAKESTDPSTCETASALATDSAMHAQELAQIIGKPGEPWHSTEAGGYLRSVIYGFNDGLTAIFGLVSGVIGAGYTTDPRFVIISGVAGAFAQALSMAASGYLAAKSQAEVQAHDIEMERYEIRLMPDLEEDELALIYEAKGLSPEQARSTAHALMADPEKALATKIREELDITESAVSPIGDGLVTGLATAVGAIIPIVPFLLTSSGWAIWISLTISMLAHFAVGAARSVFTGRGLWASGRDMFLVGFGVAAAGYVIGIGLERLMGGNIATVLP